MKAYNIYHEEIREGIPVAFECGSQPHIVIGVGDRRPIEILIEKSIESIFADIQKIKDVEIIKRSEGYVIVTMDSNSKTDNRVLVLWSLTSPGYGDARISADKDVEIVARTYELCEELVIVKMLVILRPGQELRAWLRDMHSRESKRRLRYDGKSFICCSGKWRGRRKFPILWYP